MACESPAGCRGCRHRFNDAAIQACLTFEVLFGMPLRQIGGFVASLLRSNGLERAVPDCSTPRRGQKALIVDIPSFEGKGPLRVLIDETGTTAEGETEWNAREYGGPRKRLWRWIHSGIEGGTMEVRRQLLRSAGMPECGSLRCQEPDRETSQCGLQSIPVAPCVGDGVDTDVGAASKLEGS